MSFNYEVSRKKLIYVFGLPYEYETHRGLLKIGMTTAKGDDINATANERIKKCTNTAAVPYKLLHAELAVDNFGNYFSDHDVHRVLKKFRAKIDGTTAQEWFRVDLETAKRAIAAVKQRKKFIYTKKIREEIIFRPEQEEAINRTVNFFANGNEFLWYAKMRFGKTLCAIEVVKRMNFAKTLIITHRPVVNAGWFDDFSKIFGENANFDYGSRDNGNSLKDLLGGKKNFVYFASVQDLRGSKTVGGKYDKNFALFKTKWDCVIVDEAHEGLETPLGKDVMKLIVKPNSKILRLSGTPFNIIDNFDSDSVFTWDYVMEQRAKADFEKKYPDLSNPYADLPKMNILTYNLGDILQKFYIDDDEEISFSFREFFRTDGGNFVHEDDVKSFLDLLVKRDDNNYPFSCEEWRKMFRHTFWIVPGVEAGRALSKLLQNHKIFHAFKVVNVAGDGDFDDKRGDALKKVQNAIKNYDYTITISCGKLTAGVTVPEWTAVFMLTGSNSADYKISAMSYLQTIFRVQSPCNKGGIKENCYVFDFAPDRTLKVIADSLKISTRAGKTSAEDKEIFDEFVKFCPVIAVEGSCMNTIDSNNLMQKLKRACADRVVRNGFQDNYLYNDELLRLTDLDIKKFDKLRGIIGTTKAQAKTSDIVVNAQGLTPEERKKLKAELKHEPTAAEIEARRQKTIKYKAISILRGISIRMPLLIYGADGSFDKNITIDEFSDLVDDDSWAEFMPKGVTKEIFADFIRFYDPDVFIAAGRRIRNFTKRVDNLNPVERAEKIAELFDTFKNPDKETVLTQWRVVNLHLSALPADIFAINSKILDINSKTGLYPLWIAQKIFKARTESLTLTLDEQRLIWDEIVAENVFVLCKTPMAVKITRRTLIGYRNATVNAEYFKDLIPTLKETPSTFTERIIKKDFWHKGGGKMFFDAVVGNPPYQIEENRGNQNFASPVYHLFMQSAFKLADKVSLIHPARCLFNAGATPKEFKQQLLADKHLKVVSYEADSTKFFPSSVIEGGIAITYRDVTQNFGSIGTFIKFNELNAIHQKIVVDNPNFQSLSKIIFSKTIYRLTEKFHADNPDAIKKISKGHAYDCATSIIETFPKLFFDKKPNDCQEYIKIHGRMNGERVCKYFRRDWVNNPLPLTKFKVLVPLANGSGAIGDVIPTQLIGEPFISMPFTVNTATYITVGAFDTEFEAKACISYIKSKFCRVMLGILKVTPVNPAATWAKVPLQDFTSASDIDWSGDIDAQLYRKYNLTAEEINFIETHVKKMD